MGLKIQQLEIKISVQYFGKKSEERFCNTLLFGLWRASRNFATV